MDSELKYLSSIQNREVCGGFDWWNDVGKKQPAIGTVAGKPVQSVVGKPSVKVPVDPKNHIIEVYGHVGLLIDRLVFVTEDNRNQRHTQSYTCGGVFGGMVDATPSGRCQMIGIAGTTKEVDGSQLLATMEFTWFCD